MRGENADKRALLRLACGSCKSKQWLVPAESKIALTQEIFPCQAFSEEFRVCL